MVLFLHALRICAIASVTVTIRGYVLITADVEDFKNLASRFLSADLADKLTALVAESCQENNKQQADDKAPEVSFSKVGNIVKDELFKSHKSPINISTKKGTHSPTSNNKRYRTVKNLDNKQNQSNKHYVLRQTDNDKTKLEPLYIKDELENPMEKPMEDYTYHDDNQKLNYAELTLNERNNIYSQETTNPTGLFDEIKDTNVKDMDDIFKKLDYTETKLGEWNYNPKTSQEPVNIKNVKTGYTYYLGANNEDRFADFEEPVLEEDNMLTKYSFIDIQKRNTTKLATVKNIMNDKLIIGSKTTDTENIHNKTLRMENHDSYNQYFLESKEGESQENKPEALSIEKNNKYRALKIEYKNKNNVIKKDKAKQTIESDMLNSKNPVSGERKNEVRPVKKREHNTFNRKKKMTLKNEHYTNENNMSVQNKMYSSNPKKRKEKNKKHFHNLEPSIIDKEEKNKPQKQLIEENHLYDKYALSYKTEDSHERKVSHQKVDNIDKKLEIEMEFSHEFAAKDKHERYKSNSKEKKFYNLEPSLIDKEEEKKPKKQLIEENHLYDKYALSYKTEDSRERKVSHQEVDDSEKKLETEKEFSHKSAATDKHERYKANSHEKLSFKNQKQRFRLKFAKSKGNSNTSTKVLPENLYDSLSDDREFKPEDIKARTEHLVDYVEVTKTTKHIKAITENIQDDSIEIKRKSTKRSTMLQENLDDSLSDDREVKPEDIKARTERLVDNVEVTKTTKYIKAITENIQDESVEITSKGKSTKRYIMKRTEIPKRDFYKMSSPDYYNKLPKIVEKYDFEEVLPEKDRERHKKKYVKREPALINKKIRLS